MLLLHGIAWSVLEWENNIEALAARHRVLALDLMGCGLTDKPANEAYSIRRLAKFVLDFMLARQPGAQAAFLKTLREFLDFRSFLPGPVAELHAALPGIQSPTLVVWGAECHRSPYRSQFVIGM